MEAVEIVAQNNVHFSIVAETHAHAPEREALLDRAMGLKWKKKSSQKLRRGRRPSEGLAFVARDASSGAIVGTVRLWDVFAHPPGSEGRSGGASARTAGGRPFAEERRHRQSIDVARNF